MLTDTNSVLLAAKAPSQAGAKDVRAPMVTATAGPLQSRHAFWVGDEGVKARVDLIRDNTQPVPESERYARAQHAQEPDLPSLGDPWNSTDASGWTGFSNADKFRSGGAINRQRLLTPATVALVADKMLARDFFTDLTTEGYGLPVNVIDGGLKADLSVITDRSMEIIEDGNGIKLVVKLLEHYMGATPTKDQSLAGFNPVNYGADIWGFPESLINNPAKFFLSSRIGTQASPISRRAGPNLGILWHYGRLWREISNNQSPLVGNHPRVESNLRTEKWLPYVSANRGSGNNADTQHTNSGIMPVLAHLQMGFRLRSQSDGVDSVTGQRMYIVQIEIKPIIGLWNPYNVAIAEDDYLVDAMMAPMVQLNYVTPGGSQKTATSFLRLIWDTSNSHGFLPTLNKPEGGRWMKLNANDVDFQPGEVRLFSIDQIRDAMADTDIAQMGSMNLVPRWSGSGAFVVNVQTNVQATGYNRKIFRVPEGTRIWAHDVYFQDSHHSAAQAQFNTNVTNDGDRFHPDASMAWLTFKARGGNGVYMTRYTGMWNSGVIRRVAAPAEITVPERIIGSAANRNEVLVENLTNGNVPIATWAFHLRTTTQTENAAQRTRGWIDSDPRALIGASRWDGTRADLSEQQDGWNFIGSLMGGSINMPGITDGNGGNRGLVAVGGVGLEAPQTDGSTRFRGYTGASNTPALGYTHVPLFDVPTGPLTSIGQYQHAQLGRYSFEPGFVLGNSYASVRIPLNQTVAPNFNGITGFNLYDISYDVNQRIWDRYFFSSMAPDYVGGGNSFDSAFLHRLDRLPNPRMVYQPNVGPTSIDALLSAAGVRGAEAIASRIKILGAFNVNSTSKTAWKAVLSSMVSAELPVVDPQTRVLSWENPNGIRFNRFSHVLNKQPYESGQNSNAAFWQGWRKLSVLELDQLAEAIVVEVKARGPFRSLAEFVNRNPNSSNVAHQRKGALQAALDRTVNQQGSDLPATVGGMAQRPLGSHFSAAMDGESESAGFASYLLQGDVLQSLAPILQARSDTFRIRAYGDLRLPSGEIRGKAWCEAIVQRSHDYVDGANAAWQNPVDDSIRPLNKKFGRKFQVVSFRWLDPSEI